MPVTEANLWAINRAESRVSLKTIRSNLSKLLPYVRFLEEEDIGIYHFPIRKSHRNLIRYRGKLIDARDESEISASEASHRMRAAINFYRFLQRNGLMDPHHILWQERRFNISTFDQHGFERTIGVNTTDLSIPNRQSSGIKVEGGLIPLSSGAIQDLLSIAADKSPKEFQLMLRLGLQTGMRIGTISNLKIETLKKATADAQQAKWLSLNVGPSASPPVATKLGVSGQIRISAELLQELIIYAQSANRLARVMKAKREVQGLLFLTKSGRPYVQPNTESGSAIRTLTYEVRKEAKARGCTELFNFRFHQTRCTFATRLTQSLLNKHSKHEIIALVKSMLLHKNEATTWTYIRFVEVAPLMQDAADAFTSAFLGEEIESC